MRGVHVITGAGSGIGAACARAFAETGPVLLVDRNLQAVSAVAAELVAGGCEPITPWACDVVDADSVAALADQVAARGGLRTLVHAAGVGPPACERVDDLLSVNLTGTARILTALEPQVDAGSVGICIASLASYRTGIAHLDGAVADPLASDLVQRVRDAAGGPLTPLAAYSVAKRAIRLLCAARAGAWGQRGARLFTVSPGLIADTPMGAAGAAAHAGAYVDGSALRRTGTAAEIARLCFTMAGDVGAFLTGADLLVDGGMLAVINSGDPAAATAWHSAGLQRPND